MQYDVWIWLAALILFSVIEANTVNLVTIWFIGGSLAALITALCGGALWLQGTLFLAVSVVLLACLRPFVKKFVDPKHIATNAESNIGKNALVIEDIDNLHATGAVKLGGLVWTARSLDGSLIAANSVVTVRGIEGIKLCVELAQTPVK